MNSDPPKYKMPPITTTGKLSTAAIFSNSPPKHTSSTDSTMTIDIDTMTNIRVVSARFSISQMERAAAIITAITRSIEMSYVKSAGFDTRP